MLPFTENWCIVECLVHHPSYYLTVYTLESSTLTWQSKDEITNEGYSWPLHVTLDYYREERWLPKYLPNQTCFGRWQHFCLNLLGLVSCIWHYRSQNSTGQTWKSLWYFRHCSIVVRFLSYWKDSNGEHRQQQLKTIHSLLWRAAGLCPRPCFIYSVHKTTFKLDRTSFNLQSVFCWRHSTSWFLPCRPFGHYCPTYAELHFWSKIVAGLQQAETKWWQNWIYSDQARQNYAPWFCSHFYSSW